MIETIYYEEGIKHHHRVEKILKRFSNARKISVDRYGEVFNRRNQNFRLQKLKPALILAKKHEGFVLPVPPGFGIGGTNNFYFSHMYNCMYDCRYCFLQGMYSSANYVLFVNYEDFEKEIETTIKRYTGDAITFFSGYDCDSLALESLTGFVAHMLPLFRKHPNTLLELRTKSIQSVPLNSVKTLDNCVVAYSLMPEEISTQIDTKAPSIRRRLDNMKTLADLGWKIGLRFDPMIHGKNWQTLYKGLFKQVFSRISPKCVHSVSFGALRFPKPMFKKIHNLYPDEKLFSGPLYSDKGLVSYQKSLESEIIEFCQNLVQEYVSESIVFNCSFDP